MRKLKALRESAKRNRKLYRFDKPDARLLETFEIPDGVGTLSIVADALEFTSLCPLTGQPDYGSIRIEYEAAKRCLESKSLKLYLMGFRGYGAFHEKCIRIICDDLAGVLNPNWLRVQGTFAARGGISFNPTAVYAKKAR